MPREMRRETGTPARAKRFNIERNSKENLFGNSGFAIHDAERNVGDGGTLSLVGGEIEGDETCDW